MKWEERFHQYLRLIDVRLVSVTDKTMNPLRTKRLHCFKNFTLNHNEWPTNLRYARLYWFFARTQSMSNELLVICIWIYLESNPPDFLCFEKQQVPWLLINNRYKIPNAMSTQFIQKQWPKKDISKHKSCSTQTFTSTKANIVVNPFEKWIQMSITYRK